MNAWGGAFAAAVVVQVALRLWLASRQIAAVRAHRDCVPGAFVGQISAADQQKAADYTVARTRFGRWGSVADGLTKLVFTVGGGLALIDAAVSSRVGGPDLMRGTAVVLITFVLLQCVALPFDLWRTFKIEARFGFNRSTAALYILDLAKRSLLGLTLLAPAVLVTLALMTLAGTWWWLYAWALWMGVTLALTWIAPKFIAPLFNRFTPVEDAALVERIKTILERCGFAASGGVYVMDSSRRTAHGNAHFTGIGRHKRIVLYDTLLARIDAAEIEAVLAHELGHFRLHHVRRQLIASALYMLAGMALLAALARTPMFYVALGVKDASPCMALLLFALAAPAIAFFGTPVRSWWSRRQERAADDFAVRYVPAENLIGALTKLYRDNAATLTPDRIHSSFYDSHPPAVERIDRLRLA